MRARQSPCLDKRGAGWYVKKKLVKSGRALRRFAAMEKTKQALNHVLVRLFNDILTIEERAL